MANTREIRNRIRSVKNIQQITRAMEMVAASKLKRAEDQVKSAVPYADKLRAMMSDVAKSVSGISHPLLVQRPVERTCLVLVTSDKGLCGAYNANIINKAMEYIRSLKKESVRLVIIGKKANEFFKKRPYEILKYWPFPGRDIEVSFVQEVTRYLSEAYERSEFDQVVLFYTRFKSAILTFPTQAQLLPIEHAEPQEKAGMSALYIFEPSAEGLMQKLLPKYLQNQIYLALVQAAASEQGNRMVSMRNATDNADEMIRTLTLNYNKVRQASITREILEVVAGADATVKK
ncbi:MAG: ATP synthase F1 subunit gamma [Candidatus Abyssobacteria bacterium SURF_5]|uniref:ATP synthase gamma chain n=1 Tax=Abyssobacteria bacterium (strain SURF_5) TaxID=2093360 RepID=A0A3A4MZF2_ABYX5|nr:MAG: ATP synthase F1 subunit gamma [Candidatus Abyssubacteria bacterium SURF_5]